MTVTWNPIDALKAATAASPEIGSLQPKLWSRAEIEGAALVLELTSPERMSNFAVWPDGSAQLSMGEIQSGVVTEEHRQIRSPEDLQEALDQVVRWTTSALGKG